MTPTSYSNLALRAVKYKRFLWLIVGVLTIAEFGFLIFGDGINEVFTHRILFGAGLLFVVIGWGLLLSIHWFGPSSNLSPGHIDNISGASKWGIKVQSWIAAVFLTCWFISIIALLRSIVKA